MGILLRGTLSRWRLAALRDEDGRLWFREKLTVVRTFTYDANVRYRKASGFLGSKGGKIEA